MCWCTSTPCEHQNADYTDLVEAYTWLCKQADDHNLYCVCGGEHGDACSRRLLGLLKARESLG